MKQVLASIDQLASYLEKQPMYKQEADALTAIFMRIAEKHKSQTHKKKKDRGGNPPPANLLVDSDDKFNDDDGFEDGFSDGEGSDGGDGGSSASAPVKTVKKAQTRFSQLVASPKSRSPKDRSVDEYDAFFGRMAAEKTEVDDQSGDDDSDVAVEEIDLLKGDDSIFGDSSKNMSASVRDILGKFPESHLDLTTTDDEADIVPIKGFLESMTDELLDSPAHLDGDLMGMDVPGHGYEIVKIVHNHPTYD